MRRSGPAVSIRTVPSAIMSIYPQDCQLMLSVVGDGTFPALRASLFMTTIMDNSMMAQNTCLQMCVVGAILSLAQEYLHRFQPGVCRDQSPRPAWQSLAFSNRPVLGGCAWDITAAGPGMIIYPARMIELDVILVASKRPACDRSRYHLRGERPSSHGKGGFAQAPLPARG